MTTLLIVYNVAGIPNFPERNNLKSILTTDIFQTDINASPNNYILTKNQVITKLDVQGEPGLKMSINNLPVYIGRSGIYSINNAYITSFKIVPTKRFEKDSEATETAKNNALNIFSLINIDPYDITLGFNQGNTLLDEWVASVENNIKQFNEGYGYYLQGKNGIYSQIGDEEFYNVIIDYTYEDRK